MRKPLRIVNTRLEIRRVRRCFVQNVTKPAACLAALLGIMASSMRCCALYYAECVNYGFISCNLNTYKYMSFYVTVGCKSWREVALNTSNQPF